jgi:hypothetical protein
LERLLLDPAFKAALAADPERALVGYILTDEERDLLMARISTDAGQSARVEERTSKAALFGLLGAAAQMFSVPGGGLAHVDPGASAPPDGDKLWAGGIKPDDDHRWDTNSRQSGEVHPADYKMNAVDERKFFDGLATETGIPESDGGSKDPGFLTVHWKDDAGRGGVGEPEPGDFKLPPDAADIKLAPNPTDIKLAPQVQDIKLAPDPFKLDAEEIKSAPDEFKLPTEVARPNPVGDGVLPDPHIQVTQTAPDAVQPGIKMAPSGAFKAPSAFDPPAPIEPELPQK